MLKARIAADAKDKDLMDFLFKSAGEDVSYIGDLRKRLEYASLNSSCKPY